MRNDGNWRPDFWFVVQPEPRADGLVMTQLPRSLFEVYRPVTLIERKINGRGDTALSPRPLLPGYLFVRKLSVSAPVLTRMPGVKRVFQNAVHQRFIDLLKDTEVDQMILLKPPKKTIDKALLKSGRVSSFEDLRDLLLSDPDGKVRLGAFEALMQTEGDMVASALGPNRKALP